MSARRTTGKVIFTFGDGSTTEIDAVDVERARVKQYVAMQASDDVEIRQAGLDALNGVALASVEAQVTPVVRTKAARKAARAPRPAARKIDHEEVLREFKKLVRQGHTESEARGILVSREVASQPTIYRITTKK